MSKASEDSKLVERYLQGDQEAGGMLIAYHQPEIFQFILHMVGSVQDADDLTQETFLHLLGSLKKFRGKSSLRTYLFQIARYTCWQFLKAQKKNKQVVLSIEELANPKIINSYSPSPESDIEIKEKIEKGVSAINSLSPEHKEVLLLKNFYGMSYKEMSRILKIPMGTVMSRLYNARLKLAQLYGEEN